MAEIVDINPELFNRRHPTYDALKTHWQFVEQTYKGGREWFEENIFKYIKEGPQEFEARKLRAYRFNHTREVVDLVTKYVFKTEIARKEDAPGEIQAFWKNATRGGDGIDVLMRQVDRGVSIFGQPYIVVDSTAVTPDDGGPLTVAEAKRQKARVYAYVVRPQDVLDMSFDPDGELNWILMHEVRRDDGDFFQESHDEYGCYRLWTRTHSYLYRVRLAKEGEAASEVKIKPIGAKPFHFKPSAATANEVKKKMVVEKLESVEHGLGVVPVVPVRERESDSMYNAPALIDDIAYLDRAVANYLSNMDAIIQDQTFSTLTIPIQSLDASDSAYDKVIEMGTKRIFGYDAEGGKGPEYISPDPSQAQLIIEVITKIITEIYHSIGMAGERTKMDNAAGIDNSSGVAKAYDFDRMNTMLKAKADRLQTAENRIIRLVMLWNGIEFDDDLVKYSDDFDTRGLYDEFDVANRLTLLAAPDELRRYQFAKLVDKLFPNIKADLKAAIEAELEDWPGEEVDVTSSRVGLKDQSKPEAEREQGQNNTDE